MTEATSAPGARALRPRRSNLAVPGSSVKMLSKAKGLGADQAFLDLEDACAPLVKPEARKNIVAALNEGGWGTTIRAVRVNDWTTHWTYRDVVEVVEGAGQNLDAIMLPKVQSAEQVVALDLLLTQIETTMGFEVGRIGIEAQIENAQGPHRRRRDRQGQPAGGDDHLRPGGLHGQHQHEVAGRGRAAARVRRRRRLPPHPHVDPHGRPGQRQAGDRRPVPADQGRRRVPPRRVGRSAALGFDGKWVLHPGQLDPANEVFSPRQEDYDHAENILDAYEWFTSAAGGAKGAAMLGDEMIDEASRKMALVVSGKGRAAGMERIERLDTPGELSVALAVRAPALARSSPWVRGDHARCVRLLRDVAAGCPAGRTQPA